MAKVQNRDPQHTHRLRKLLQGIKQLPSNTDTRKATVQHSIPAEPGATHQSQLGGAQNTNMISNPCTGKLELMQEGSALLDASGIMFGLAEEMMLCHSAHSCSKGTLHFPMSLNQSTLKFKNCNFREVGPGWDTNTPQFWH